MGFKYGDALRFKKDIPISTWVNGLYPKGQLGMIEDHIGVQINAAKFHIPQSLAAQLFEIDIPEEKIIIPEKKEPIETEETEETETLKKVDLEIAQAVLKVEKSIKSKVEKKRGRKPKNEKK